MNHKGGNNIICYGINNIHSTLDVGSSMINLKTPYIVYIVAHHPNKLEKLKSTTQIDQMKIKHK